MHNEFEMSMLGELKFFLGLQISQTDKGILISQTKYINEMLKKFQIQDCKSVGTPMVTRCKLSNTDESVIQMEIGGHPPIPLAQNNCPFWWFPSYFSTVFRVPNFQGCFEALNDLYW